MACVTGQYRVPGFRVIVMSDLFCTTSRELCPSRHHSCPPWCQQHFFQGMTAYVSDYLAQSKASQRGRRFLAPIPIAFTVLVFVLSGFCR